MITLSELEEIVRNSNFTKDKKIKIINDYFDKYQKEIDQTYNKYAAKQYLGAALEIGSAAIPFGAGTVRTAGIAAKIGQPLKQYLGRKISQKIGEGTALGAISSAIHGTGLSFIDENINPFVQIPIETVSGGILGGVGGALLGKGEQIIAGKIINWINKKILN